MMGLSTHLGRVTRRDRPSPRSVRSHRDKLSSLQLFINGGRDVTLAAVANYRTLRARGYTVKTVDCLIATLCISAGHTLLHNDRDYDVFEKELGLAVVHPEVT